MESKIELLAPAGTWEALEAVIEAGADAVYLGGKRFNMRMHRKDFNFDNKQLSQAVQYSHQRNVKLYVTVNNLLSDWELKDMVEFLKFLDEIGVDAVIIQDLAMLGLLNELDLGYGIHASVMMNTGNLDTIQYLKDRGVSRVVTSREMSLEQIKRYRELIDMEFEYFVHGDMCYAQSGQCLHSGILFGKSSNQGRCLKPCRWPLRMEDDKEFRYYLAVKDMCMYYNLRELIQSGVSSFKVEGRMRSPQYLKFLITSYRREIDRYLSDPSGYVLDFLAGQKMYDKRIREFSTCFALGYPGQEFIDQTGKREPKVFSRAVNESEVTKESTMVLKKALLEKNSEDEFKKTVGLAVTVPTFSHFQAVLNTGVERVIIGGDTFRPNKPWGKEEVTAAIRLGNLHGQEVVYRTPTIVMEKEMNDLKELFSYFSEYHLRIMTGNLGVIEALYGADLEFSLYGDYGLNIFNSQTCQLLKQQGFQSVVISTETGIHEVKQIGQRSSLEVEILAQGPLRGMVSDNCLRYQKDGMCHLNCHQGVLLIDRAGCSHLVEFDQYCRNHIFLQNHVALLPILGELALNGISIFRIEGMFYTPEELVQIIELYHKIIRYDYDPEIVDECFSKLQDFCQVPLTYGALISKIGGVE